MFQRLGELKKDLSERVGKVAQPHQLERFSKGRHVGRCGFKDHEVATSNKRGTRNWLAEIQTISIGVNVKSASAGQELV